MHNIIKPNQNKLKKKNVNKNEIFSIYTTTISVFYEKLSKRVDEKKLERLLVMIQTINTRLKFQIIAQKNNFEDCQYKKKR